MSTVDYGIYKIGTNGLEFPGFFDILLPSSNYWEKNVTNVIVPTYGLWGGPGWSAGSRSSDIDWTVAPCRNENVKTSSTPDNCYSLVDAICKTHDWNYDQAEKKYAIDGDELKYEAAIMAADIQLLHDIAVARDTGTYVSPTGEYNAATGTFTSTHTYTGTFDTTEITYLSGLEALFIAKIMAVDNIAVLSEEAKTAAKTYVTSFLSSIPVIGTVFENPSDPAKKTIVDRKDGIIVLQNESNGKSNAWIMDLNINTDSKPINVNILYGTGSTKADDIFVLPGNGVIHINGGTANDAIVITGAKNYGNTTYTFEIAGGGGLDRYYLDKDYNYKLIDNGANEIYVEDDNGKWNKINSLYKQADGTYKTLDGGIAFSGNTLTLATGRTVQMNDSFQSGDFGINLITLPTNPAMDNTITGDLSPVDFDPNTAGIQTRTDEWGNIITDPDQPDPGRADTLFDTPGNDLIISGGGDDVVHSFKGGQNRIQGGAGCDILDGDNSSSCIIEGGADSDIIFGGINGNSRLFGDTYGDMAALITDGEEAQDNGLKGDIVAVCYGDNYLYGSDGWDILWGGTGRDLIVAGAGNDLIIGDGGDITANYGDNYTWSFSITENNDVYTPVITGLYSYDMNASSGDADVIYAGTGNDYVDAGGGDDEIYGGTGNDTLFGEAGYDFIEGGDGDDILIGDNGDLLADSLSGGDYIDGGAGHDEIDGNAGHDELFGGADNDTIYGGEGDDHIDGEAGADSLYGGAGADVMFGGDNNDYMEGDHYDVAGDDYLDGEAGNDTIIGAGGADIIFGGADDDRLYGDAANIAAADHGDDYIDGEGGHNLIVGFGGNDTLYALDGNDTIYGGDGNDDIDAGDGGNMVLGGAGHDDIWAGKDNDWIQGDTGDDYLDGGAGHNTLIGGDGSDVIYGGMDDDILQGDDSNSVAPGNDYLDGQAGNDTLIGLGGADTLFGGSGHDFLQGDTGDDYLDGGADHDYMMGMDGADTLFGGSDNDSVWGGGGDDKIYGEAGNDQLAGEFGDDYIDGGSGHDFLQGGSGSDTLIGGSGSDTYFFNLGDGIDTIDDTASDDGLNVLIFGDGITFNILRLNVGSLDILIGDNGDAIHFDHFDPNDAYGAHAIDIFEFADGTALTYRELIDLGFEIEGTSGDDQLSGTSAPDSIFGLEGNDSIASGAGDDMIDGGAGDDTLYGGTGTDTLIGGAGTDTYLFNFGDGVDTIVDTSTISEGNRIFFGGGITAEDLTFAINGHTLTIHYGENDAVNLLNFDQDEIDGNSLVVRVLGFFDEEGALVSEMNLADFLNQSQNHAPVVAHPIADQTINKCTAFRYIVPGDTFKDIDVGDTLTYSATLADGSVLPSWLTFDAATMTFSGTPTCTGKISVKVTATDTSGAGVSDTFDLDIKRVTYGTHRCDLIVACCDNDLIYAFNGVDTVYSGAGDDIIYGGNYRDFLFGECGNDLIYGEHGNDNLYGGGGHDTLDGGTGADHMIGGCGNDTYIVDKLPSGLFNFIPGDTVTEYDHGGTDTVQSSVSYTLGSNVENLTLTGTSGIHGAGNALHNVLIGNGASNTLTGHYGNDTLVGGSGNDILKGGSGGDTYLFGNADGADTIHETAGIGGDLDVLKLTEATTTDPVIVKQGNDLYVFMDADHYLRIAGEFRQANYGIERLEVSDGHYITRNDIQTIVDTMSAINNAGMDVIQKYNAMMNDEQYQNILAQSWQQ